MSGQRRQTSAAKRVSEILSRLAKIWIVARLLCAFSAVILSARLRSSSSITSGDQCGRITSASLRRSSVSASDGGKRTFASRKTGNRTAQRSRGGGPSRTSYRPSSSASRASESSASARWVRMSSAYSMTSSRRTYRCRPGLVNASLPDSSNLTNVGREMAKIVGRLLGGELRIERSHMDSQPLLHSLEDLHQDRERLPGQWNLLIVRADQRWSFTRRRRERLQDLAEPLGFRLVDGRRHIGPGVACRS